MNAAARGVAQLTLLLGVSGLSFFAEAQTQQELATRRVLLEQASASRAAGNHTEALSIAQRAGEVRMTPSLRLFIAQELDATGDPAAALGVADLCVHDVERDLTVAHRAALLTTCRELMEVTRARVGFLVVRPPSPVPEGLSVTVRGAPLASALLGVSNVVSPGALAVEARAPGFVRFSTRREVASGATVEVDLELSSEPVVPGLVVEPPPVAVAPPVVVVAPPVRLAPRPPAPRSLLAPALFFSGGAASFAGAAVLFAARAAALDGCTVVNARAECDTIEALNAARSANGLAAGAAALLGVGVAAVGVGVVMLLRRGSSARPVGWTASVAPARGGVVFGLTARFP